MANPRIVSGGTVSALRAFGLVAVMASLLTSPVAGNAATASDEDRESPRVAAAVGPVGVVVVAANRKVYAFLDRLSDNAPVAGGTVTVKAGKHELTLKESAPGVYRAGPFEPTVGSIALTVSINTALASGQMVADLVVAPNTPPQTVESRLRSLWYGVGLVAVAGLGVLAWRSRRRPLPPLAGTPGTA